MDTWKLLYKELENVIFEATFRQIRQKFKKNLMSSMQTFTVTVCVNNLTVLYYLSEISNTVFSRFFNKLLSIFNFRQHFVERIYDKNGKIKKALKGPKIVTCKLEATFVSIFTTIS